MNRERVKEMLEVYAAYARGNDLQYRLSDMSEWIDLGSTECTFTENVEYRVKPVPQYLVVPVDPLTGKVVNGFVNVFDNPPTAADIMSFKRRLATKYETKVIRVCD